MVIKIEEDYDDFYDPEDDYDFTDYSDYDDETRESFAKDMFDFLTDIIKQGEIIGEKFTSDKNENVHFNKHCIGKSSDKRSTKRRIYYDFKDNSQYSDYEKQITNEIRNTDMIVDSLDDYDTIMKYMKKLFEGDCTVTFTKSCGLKDETGHISVSFSSSHSSSVTSNYEKGSTVDICIKGKGNKTVSLYAVDFHNVQSRLNNIIKNNVQPGDEKEFIFNND